MTEDSAATNIFSVSSGYVPCLGRKRYLNFPGDVEYCAQNIKHVKTTRTGWLCNRKMSASANVYILIRFGSILL